MAVKRQRLWQEGARTSVSPPWAHSQWPSNFRTLLTVLPPPSNAKVLNKPLALLHTGTDNINVTIQNQTPGEGEYRCPMHTM